MATITEMVNGSPLVPGVLPKLNYRSDITSGDAQRWIVSALRLVSSVFPFEELCFTGPVVNFTIGQAVYPISYFTSSSQFVTRIDSFWVQLSPSPTPPVILVGNTTAVEMKYRAVKTVAPLATIIGLPIYYTIYGANASVPGSQNVQVAFSPDQAYYAQSRYQIKHPFTDGVNDIIQLPDEWLEKIATAAAFIGADENRMADRMEMLSKSLPPQFMAALKSGRAQMGNVNERQITFIAGDM